MTNFLISVLLLALTIALLFPAPGRAASRLEVAGVEAVQTLCVFIIFFSSGLTLRTDEFTRALRNWPVALWGFAVVLLVTPALALVPPTLGFISREFQVGFMIFCVVPTTINSGIRQTEAAGGSFAMALMLSVTTNMVGVFTVPFVLSLLLEIEHVAALEPLPLLTKLLAMLFTPLLLGKGLQESSSRARRFVRSHKKLLANVSNVCLATMPWMKLSLSRESIVSLGAADLASLASGALVIHLVYLTFNYGMSHYVWGFPKELEKAVVIMGSQKTFPVAITVATALPLSVGEPGLIAIPIIVAQQTQIFCDAFLASRWAAAKPQQSPSEASAPDPPRACSFFSRLRRRLAPSPPPSPPGVSAAVWDAPGEDDPPGAAVGWAAAPGWGCGGAATSCSGPTAGHAKAKEKGAASGGVSAGGGARMSQ